MSESWLLPPGKERVVAPPEAWESLKGSLEPPARAAGRNVNKGWCLALRRPPRGEGGLVLPRG